MKDLAMRKLMDCLLAKIVRGNPVTFAGDGLNFVTNILRYLYEYHPLNTHPQALGTLLKNFEANDLQFSKNALFYSSKQQILAHLKFANHYQSPLACNKKRVTQYA